MGTATDTSSASYVPCKYDYLCDAYKYIYIYTQKYIYFTGRPVIVFPRDYLLNCSPFEKIFRTRVALFRVELLRIRSLLLWVGTFFRFQDMFF